MSFEPHAVLKRILVTERSTQLKELNKYVFEVLPESTKGQIRQAVETVFKVDVLDVNTSRVHGKMRRRMGRAGGYQSDWKKAIVTVKKGQEIKIPEATV
ncbi:MAG TPA: 50S ribosomal protein L23 [Elusimicrobiota bacterium]|nr:50S ribosomal protein L23 [Elusimicrobiota bacterium]